MRPSKYPLDFEVQGSPFTLVNTQGISDGKFMNKTLNDIPLKELIEFSEKPEGQQTKIIETFKSSALRPSTYLNTSKIKNCVQLKDLFNGMSSLTDIMHL